jgi:ribonuclease R
VHVTALPRDYYHRDPTGTELRGERSGNKYRLTDKLRVRLAAVNVEERKIDFVPIEREDAPSAGAKAPSSDARGAAKQGRRHGAPANDNGGGKRRDSRSSRRKRGRG